MSDTKLKSENPITIRSVNVPLDLLAQVCTLRGSAAIDLGILITMIKEDAAGNIEGRAALNLSEDPVLVDLTKHISKAYYAKKHARETRRRRAAERRARRAEEKARMQAAAQSPQQAADNQEKQADKEAVRKMSPVEPLLLTHRGDAPHNTDITNLDLSDESIDRHLYIGRNFDRMFESVMTALRQDKSSIVGAELAYYYDYYSRLAREYLTQLVNTAVDYAEIPAGMRPDTVAVNFDYMNFETQGAAAEAYSRKYILLTRGATDVRTS